MSLNLRNALSNAFVGSGGGGATLAANTFTGQQVISANGAASTPPLLLSGTIFTGGSSSTTKPALLVEQSGSTSNNWSTGGTLIGANAPSGFTGNLFDYQINGTRYLALSGTVLVPGSSGGTDLGQYNLGFGTLRVRTIFAESGSGNSAFSCNQDIGVELGQTAQLGWGSGAASVGDNDAYFVRSAASIIGILGASAGGGALELSEMTAPASPASNKARLYIEDNGSGKTRLMVIFPSGAAQQIAIEP